MKCMAPVLLLVAAMSAQNAPSTNKGRHLDIPAISREANGTVVSIIMADNKGQPIAQGSGFVVTRNGLVVTNYHVIKNGTSAVIKLPDGSFFTVDGVLAFDKDRDIAAIKAHGINFKTVALGDSDRLQIGDEVVAIGSPLSLESTVSNGIVSGIRTEEQPSNGSLLDQVTAPAARKLLQITAPISHGSSGGPLFNLAGQVIGITSAALIGGENLNFAVPINDAKKLLGTST
jgi:S1-C subfamily serine protease